MWIQILITAGALFVALLHSIFPDIRIDSSTVALIVIAVIPWLGVLFRSLELPGGLKIEYQEIKEAKNAAVEAGFLENEASPKKPKQTYAFEAIAEDDPNLALSGLRIAIESRIREIYNSKNAHDSRIIPLRQVLNRLQEQEILQGKEYAAILDILPLLNRAAHGAHIDTRSANIALEVGIGILRTLDDRREGNSISNLLQRWRHRDGAAVAEIGEQLSKAFVSAPILFLQEMKKDPDSFSAWLNDMEHHTFTLLSSQGDIDDILYTAFYEKLKLLMLEAAEKAKNTEFHNEAVRIIDVLQKTEIQRTW